MNIQMIDQIRATFGSGYHQLAQLEIVTTNGAACDGDAISSPKLRTHNAHTLMKAKDETSDSAFHAFCQMWLQACECAGIGNYCMLHKDESHVD